MATVCARRHLPDAVAAGAAVRPPQLAGHRNWPAILLLNALLGWTVLCWFSAPYLLFDSLIWEGRMERQVADLRAEVPQFRQQQGR